MRILRAIFILITIFSLSFNSSANSIECETLTPDVHAPADVVVSCCYWFSLGMLDDINSSAFGRFVYGQSNIRKLVTIDKVCPAWCEYDPNTGYDPDDFNNGQACNIANRNYNRSLPNALHHNVWGWDGYVNNWTSAVTVRIDDRRKCGTGLVIRRFIIEDRGVRYYDDQEIWIVDCDPFYVSDECTDPDDDIEWPNFCQQPDPLDGCFADISPENPALGKPVIVNGGDNQCNLISIDFVDDTITIEKNACLKVLRKWIVIDWCKYHPLRNPYKGRWEFLQVIKVRDKLDPQIECEIGECTPAFKDSLTNECVAYIELRATGIDSCTAQNRLRYEYKIDLFNDGKGVLGDFDVKVGPLSTIDVTPVQQMNPYAEFGDSVLNASGTYPIGIHRLKWFVEDGCGNIELCDTLFEISDCKEPTPYCKPGIITVIMPSSKSIEIWAKDYDDGSFDNCSDSLTFSFSSDIDDQSRLFDCDSLGVRDITIWVTDEEGNQDFCKTKIEIQDNQDVCQTTSNIAHFQILKMMPGGHILISDISYQLYVDNVLIKEEIITNTEFGVDFSGLQGKIEVGIFDNSEFTLNGISTKDRIGLMRHLLGIVDFSSYDQLLAADLNADQILSSADLSLNIKVIRSNNLSQLMQGKSNYIFSPENAINFDRINPLKHNMRHEIDLQNLLKTYDFRPIKRGDTN